MHQCTNAPASHSVSQAGSRNMLESASEPVMYRILVWPFLAWSRTGGTTAGVLSAVAQVRAQSISRENPPTPPTHLVELVVVQDSVAHNMSTCTTHQEMQRLIGDKSTRTNDTVVGWVGGWVVPVRS
jgi:hypothetical protein